MTAFFQDAFNGTAGAALTGRTADITFSGQLWYDGSWITLSGDGAALPTGTSVASSNTAYVGDFGSDYGNPLSFDTYFSWRSGPSVAAGALAHFGVEIDLRCGSKQTAVRIYTPTTNGIWVLSIETPGSGAVTTAVIGMAPDTIYNGVISVANGAQSVTVNGVTCAISTAWISAIGCNAVGIGIGGTTRLLSLSVGAPMPAALPVAAMLQTASPLSYPALPGMLLSNTIPPMAPRLAAASPLGAASLVLLHDFTGLVGNLLSLYTMDLVTAGGLVRVPVSSWQATLQTGSSCYVQCVVPACSAWWSAINAATGFVISRRAVLPGGAVVEYEMARAPAEAVQFDQGPARYTCTLSGWAPEFAEDLDPPAVFDCLLAGVRSVSRGSKVRVRCAIDWLLRPGHRAFVQGVPFVVRYINYYAPSGSDAYMDVGD